MLQNKHQNKENIAGKYARRGQKTSQKDWRLPVAVLPVAFFLIELFAFFFLSAAADASIWETLRKTGYAAQDVGKLLFWPLAFGAIWAVLLTGIVRLLPEKIGRIAFGILYFIPMIYTGVQTGYFQLFKNMMWISDFRYASEGSDYFSVLLSYPLSWYAWLVGLILVGVLILWKFPRRHNTVANLIVPAVTVVVAIIWAVNLPQAVFAHDREVRYAGSDYGRAQSAEAAYENMFNAHRLYQVCGIYQTGIKDVYSHHLYPLLPGYAAQLEQNKQIIDDYFDQRSEAQDNAMTGIFEGKNVVLVLMESMDDWGLGEHTPTLNKLMAEGINFTNFYTPPYGGVRTFNSEFCINTGSFLSSQGGYAFDYVTNDFRQSLASLLTQDGYTAKVYHYNDPSFYSRGVFSPAMGYDEYVCYEDYVTQESKNDLYNDLFLFNYQQVSDSFFREGQRLNFIITRSAHLSYKYNEVLSHWGLKKYPEYRGMTGHQEEDMMYLKARLIDDMFARLLQELEQRGELDNTVIIGVTDHYTYGVDDEQLVLDRSGVDDMLLVEKTPCFIWSNNGPSIQEDKTLSTADFLPTVLNLMGIDSPYRYIGRDAFDESYEGYALFSNGSWVQGDAAYNAANGRILYLTEDATIVTQEKMDAMAELLSQFVRINNLILETDYYKDR